MRSRLLGGLFVMALVLGWPQGAGAYRTAADLREIPDGQTVAWTTAPAIRHFPGRVPGVSTVDVERALERARETWEAVSCSAAIIDYAGVTSREVAPDDGFNTLQWVFANWASRGFASDAAATTDVLYEQDADGAWHIVEADIYLNAGEHAWREAGGEGPDDPRDLPAVLTHELGHFLGLMHPCEPGGADGAPACSSSPSFEQTTMYPLYRGPAGRELSPDDVAGACFLYPAHACATAGCSGGLVCSADGCVEGCGGRVCAADESCNAGECVRDVPTAECAADADCASSDRCALGRCVSSGAGFGDPCDSADACASTLCTEGGYCGASCATDADCPARSACDAGACIPEAGVFGDACEMADDCVTGLCLDDGEARATCTRTCASLEQCPVGLTCGDVDGERVCRPPESSGCAASGDGPASGVLSVLVLLFFWRRR